MHPPTLKAGVERVTATLFSTLHLHSMRTQSPLQGAENNPQRDEKQSSEAGTRKKRKIESAGVLF